MASLALGTVQFGLDYGINNTKGKVDETTVESILKYACLNKINLLDTALAYGDSEKVIGKVKGSDKFKIVSKLPPCSNNEVQKYFKQSLENLNVDYLYGYLIHNFNILEKDLNIWKALKDLKSEGKIKKIGISLYAPMELKKLWEWGIDLDLIQVPYNIFDRRFEVYFNRLKQLNVEIHTRSVFLQGLFFKEIQTLPNNFQKVITKLQRLKSISKKHQLSTSALCLNFVLSNKEINYAVVGVDNLEQLKQNVSESNKLVSKEIQQELTELEVKDEHIINPSNWKL